ncbi:hypothetical protein HBH98_252600 [Parastagonospora nodorum]|nr:hypothetical protein HBI06_255020 [Parastagonospora nodorum]KAH4332784.1 hypothetical protein HBH98_252600 [Parastagonospora nodorum]KAH4354359.1 hypothetical protein HBH97_249820 [Parastagonospora nodorum]KAH5088400.1 hypothetical protein HBH72_247260 [Parastagonospora nodorum]KAH5388981.1 hypothetical protein HBI32_254200 [Parastagonospora nodorum]
MGKEQNRPVQTNFLVRPGVKPPFEDECVPESPAEQSGASKDVDGQNQGRTSKDADEKTLYEEEQNQHGNKTS